MKDLLISFLAISTSKIWNYYMGTHREVSSQWEDKAKLPVQGANCLQVRSESKYKGGVGGSVDLSRGV